MKSIFYNPPVRVMFLALFMVTLAFPSLLTAGEFDTLAVGILARHATPQLAEATYTAHDCPCVRIDGVCKCLESCGWKKGPLPAGTWQWGGVMVHGESTMGFHFADFKGDHVLLFDKNNRRVEAWEVAFYNNSLTLPLPKELLAKSEVQMVSDTKTVEAEKPDWQIPISKTANEVVYKHGRYVRQYQCSGGMCSPTWVWYPNSSPGTKQSIQQPMMYHSAPVRRGIFRGRASRGGCASCG